MSFSGKSYLYDCKIPRQSQLTAYLDAVACTVAPAAGTSPPLVCVSESVCAAPANEHFFAPPCLSRLDAVVIDEYEAHQFFAVAGEVTDVPEVAFEFYAECLSAAKIASFALAFSDAAVFVAVSPVCVFAFCVIPTTR
jgi:hypothetical protein